MRPRSYISPLWLALVILAQIVMACISTTGAPRTTATTTPRTLSLPTPAPTATPCPDPTKIPQVGVRPFPPDRQPPAGLIPTNYAVARAANGRIYAIYVGTRADDQQKGLVVAEEIDPCTGTSRTQPEYYSFPFWNAPLQILLARADPGWITLQIDGAGSFGQLAPLYVPVSGRVEQGRAYPFEIWTHCGIDERVDFDGSLWDVDDPEWAGPNVVGSRIGNPSQKGTMTLVDADHSVFRFDRKELRFRRHQGPKLAPGFCA